MDMKTVAAEAPKLEEFLSSPGDHPLGEQFVGGYDSDLRSIAAGILRASPAEQPESTSLAVADPKKVMDTFGQRTSIYRGVTRYFNANSVVPFSMAPKSCKLDAWLAWMRAAATRERIFG